MYIRCGGVGGGDGSEGGETEDNGEPGVHGECMEHNVHQACKKTLSQVSLVLDGITISLTAQCTFGERRYTH